MWNESIALALPKKFEEVPEKELWVHVLLWDYDSSGRQEVEVSLLAAFDISFIRFEASDMQNELVNEFTSSFW